jgi:catechol 2,3-dioxygenase-like lactoylglutathione lyase family enzyme
MAPQIKHIAIFAKDQLKMVEFYKTTFGMEQVHQHDSEGDKSRQAYYLSDGHINLAILPAGDREEGIDHFGFEIEDFEATARTAMAAGASEAPKDVPQDGRFAEGFIRDPVGTRIDLSQRGWLTKSVG